MKFSRTFVTVLTSTGLAVSALAGDDWYQPPPPRTEGPLILPITATRLSRPIPPTALDLAVSKLVDREAVPIDREECAILKVPFSSNELLHDAINSAKTELERHIEYLRLFPLNGSRTDISYHAHEQGILQAKEEIAHWQNLKGRLRPYLVRAVAADDMKAQFDTSLWNDYLTVINTFWINNSRNDPLRSHASISDAKPAHVFRWPVVVYLEKLPLRVYTVVETVRLGR